MDNEKEKFLQAAMKIGLRISRDAIWDADRCNWIGSNMDETSGGADGGYPKTYFRSLGPELYSGTSGVAVFLASLFSLCSDRVVGEAAEGGIRQALSRVAGMDEKSQLGLFSGRLGIAYAAILTGEKLREESFVAEGQAMMTRLCGGSHDGAGLDVIEGYAGVIPVMLRLWRDFGKEEFKNFAIRSGEHLTALAQQEDVGCSWNTTDFRKRNLTGFAHGVAGIVHALWELFRATGEERFGAAAAAGIEYENHYFDSVEQNWPDFRVFPNHSGVDPDKIFYSCAWCHGAPGIGLSRLRAFEITGRENYLRDVEAAIATTRLKNNLRVTPNFSLCHGLLGNAELFLESARILSRPELLEDALRPAIILTDEFLDQGVPIPNGMNNNFDNPELMTGTAGMGYYLLRLVDSEAFPSLLLV